MNEHKGPPRDKCSRLHLIKAGDAFADAQEGTYTHLSR